MRLKIRFPRLPFALPALPALPVLAPAEKTALLALALLLSAGAALRVWERSGVRIGPVEDWETLRRLVIRARTDWNKAEGGGGFSCDDEAPAGGFAAGTEEEPSLLAAGFAGGSAREKRGAAKSADSRKKTPPRPVDPNTAGEKALLTLPGVGPSTAKAILAHRAAHGNFRAAEDLLQVKGIGPKKLETLRPFLKLEAQVEKQGSREQVPFTGGD